MKELYFTTRPQWREWLSRNHDKVNGIWLVFYKKETNRPGLSYDDAVEEALCFGWVDSLIKNLDGQRYARKVTPRNSKSKWSASNIKRVERLSKQKLMTQAGQNKIDAARKAGLFKPAEAPQISFAVPGEMKQALSRNKKAAIFFNTLAPNDRKRFIGWINIATRTETRMKRIREAIKLLEQEKKLGLK